MIIENELDVDISGFHLNALSSGLPLNVDLDATLTVLAGNCYRAYSPASCPATSKPPPDRLWRNFHDNTGFPELDLPVPWCGRRRLRFGFPPRLQPQTDYFGEAA